MAFFKKNTKKIKAGRNNRRLTIINISFSLIAILTAVWIVSSYLHLSENTYTDDAQVEAYINPINSRVSGYIDEVRFNDHQQVKKGDTLVTLIDNELQTAENEADASLQNTLAAKQASISAINTAKSNLQVIQSSIEGEKAKLKNAQQNYERYLSLLKDEAVTRQQYEQMETGYEVEKAQISSLQNQLVKAQLAVKQAEMNLPITEAQIKGAEGGVKLAQINRSYAVIMAPCDGVIGRRTINPGQLISAGQQVATIVENGHKWIVANFREKQMQYIEPGKLINVRVDALGDKKLEGKVTAIAEATGSSFSAVPVDNSTGNFVKVQQRIPVRIEFTKNNDQKLIARLRTGMNAEVELKEK